MTKSNLDRKGKPLPIMVCPVCSYEADCATDIDGSDARPKAGDLTICIQCGEILEYLKDLTPSKVSVGAMLRLSSAQRAKIGVAQFLIRSKYGPMIRARKYGHREATS